MASKSLPTTSTAPRWASSRQLACHSDPINYTAEDCRSHGTKKSSKRNSEESLRRASNRSRTSGSVSQGCSQTCSRPSLSDDGASCASVHTSPLGSTGHNSVRVLGTGQIESSSKRKVTDQDNIERPRKRSRTNRSPTEDQVHTFTEETSTLISSSTTASWEGRKSRETPSPFECLGHKPTNEASSSDTPGTSSSTNTIPPDNRAAFEAKYNEQELLGAGGFGTVFAGQRRVDNLPVAIKHIPQFDIKRTSMLLNGAVSMVPMEVALMLRVKPGAAGSSAAVSLLDWYDLDYELILILERPVPCLDLIEYMMSRGSALQENMAKTITKQLVDAVIEVHSTGVFHRDIKLDNILIETGSNVPRVRLIDFGCGTFLSEREYITEQGTYGYTSPEWFLHGCYRAESTTVWQLGVVLFGMLHGYLPFSNSTDIVHENPDVSNNLSFNCQAFLQSCLTKSPEARPALETLKQHPWLI